MWVRIGESHDRRGDARLCVDASSEPGRQCAIAPRSDVEYFELGAGADTFRVGPARERPPLLGGSICLRRENPLDDLVDDGGFIGQVPIGLAASDTEPSDQEQHDATPSPKNSPQAGDELAGGNAWQKTV